MLQTSLITEAFSAFVLARLYRGIFRLINTLNLRFPTLLNVALSLPQRMSYGLMSSALMSAGFFSSSSVSDVSTGGFFKLMSSDFSDFSSLLSMSFVVVPNASFLSEYSRRCCFTEIFAKDDFPKSISLLVWYRSPVGKSILTGCSIDNILCFFFVTFLILKI